MKSTILSIIIFLLTLLFSANPVFATEYDSLKNTVILPGTVNEIGAIVGHYQAGQLQQGDSFSFRLPMGSFWTKANIDTDESTAMTLLQTRSEWETATLLDASNMRYGTNYNYILVPAAYAGNMNGLFNGANPNLEVTSYSKGEVFIKVSDVIDAAQECYLILYSNSVYVTDNVNEDISIEINSPSNQALNASVPGGTIPASLKPEENNQPQPETDKPGNAEIIQVNPADSEPGTKLPTKVEFEIGQKQISINGSVTELPVVPYISQGKTYVPVRFIAEALGIKPSDITWDVDLNQITLKQNNDTIGINPENNTITLNGHLAYVLDTPVEIAEPGYTMVPIRYIAQALGASIIWNGSDNSILITK